MLADARDTAEAAVPPETAVSGETRPLVQAKVAAPGAEPKKDAEQEASQEIARSDALLAAWESQRKETEAAEPFALTVQPLMGGADAALTLDGVDGLCVVVGAAVRVAGPYYARDLLLSECSATPSERSSRSAAHTASPITYHRSVSVT